MRANRKPLKKSHGQEPAVPKPYPERPTALRKILACISVFQEKIRDLPEHQQLETDIAELKKDVVISLYLISKGVDAFSKFYGLMKNTNLVVDSLSFMVLESSGLIELNPGKQKMELTPYGQRFVCEILKRGMYQKEISELNRLLSNCCL